MKIYTHELGQMTSMAAMPIYGKNLKTETLYVASCMGVLPKLFKL